jgi:hypothetical protein
MGHIDSLDLSNGATVRVGDHVITNEHLPLSEDDAWPKLEADPHKVEEITFDSDFEPSGRVRIHLGHWRNDISEPLEVSPQRLVEWMDARKAVVAHDATWAGETG